VPASHNKRASAANRLVTARGLLALRSAALREIFVLSAACGLTGRYKAINTLPAAERRARFWVAACYCDDDDDDVKSFDSCVAAVCAASLLLDHSSSLSVRAAGFHQHRVARKKLKHRLHASRIDRTRCETFSVDRCSERCMVMLTIT